MMRAFAGSVLLVVLLCTCKSDNSVPSGILKPEKMQAVMWDMMRAEVLTDNFITKDSSKNNKAENVRLQKQIFIFNSVTKEEYYKSFEYYKKNPTLLGVLLDSLTAKATRDREKILKPVTGK